MKQLKDTLLTPIHLKTRNGADWPQDEKVFYLLSRDGLFLCRNHAFFRSCVPAPDWPPELEGQQSFLKIQYPKVPALLVERIVGFFDAAWNLLGGEAAVLLAWHHERQRVYPIVPRQVATVHRTRAGTTYPSRLHYETPSLPPSITIFCDLHSHCDAGAYTSTVDEDDESFRPGLHAIVGRLRQEPPQFHTSAMADGLRFRVKERVLFGSYRRRRMDFPRSWLRRIEVREEPLYVPPPRSGGGKVR